MDACPTTDLKVDGLYLRADTIKFSINYLKMIYDYKGKIFD